MFSNEKVALQSQTLEGFGWKQSLLNLFLFEKTYSWMIYILLFDSFYTPVCFPSPNNRIRRFSLIFWHSPSLLNYTTNRPAIRWDRTRRPSSRSFLPLQKQVLVICAHLGIEFSRHYFLGSRLADRLLFLSSCFISQQYCFMGCLDSFAFFSSASTCICCLMRNKCSSPNSSNSSKALRQQPRNVCKHRGSAKSRA